MSIKLIIFDFDGTLGDTRRNIVVTMQDVMKELGLPLQDEDVCFYHRTAIKRMLCQDVSST